MTIDSLDAGLSDTVNGVLGLLHAKASTATVRSAINLRFADPGPIALSLAGLLPLVLGSLEAVSGFKTVTGLFSMIDTFVRLRKRNGHSAYRLQLCCSTDVRAFWDICRCSDGYPVQDR